MKSIYSDLILFLVALLWGTTFVASKYLLVSITPLYMISIRFLMAVVIMSLIFRKHLFNIKYEDIKGGIIVGLMLFMGFASQLIALQYTQAGKQAFLAGTYVVMVPFIIWFLTKKRPDTRSFLGAIICFLGIGFLTLNEKLTISYGDTLTLISSLFFAFHILVTDYYTKKIDVVKLTIVQFTTVAILSSISAIIFEPFPVGLSFKGTIAITYLGVLCTAVAYFLQTYAQKYSKSTHTAIILSLEAVFGSILSIILLKELFTLKMIIGSLAIFSAILLIEIKPSKKLEKV